MKKFLLMLPMLILCVQTAYAIDPGRVRGIVRIHQGVIEIKEVFAHFHDNAEGLLDRPREIRVVLADRAVPQESLRGIASLPVIELAREGKLRGLLLQFDPSDRNRMVVTLLQPPPHPNASMMTLPLVTTGQDLFKSLSISKTRIGGEMVYPEKSQTGGESPSFSWSVKFSAPLFHELPVTADLNGKAALDSPQVRMLREKIKAMKEGDLEAAGKAASKRANRRTTEFIAWTGGNPAACLRQDAADLEKSLKTVQRVVEREDRAVVIFSDGNWMNFVREEGRWKTD